MAETPTLDVKALFKRWRSGDAEAGVSMAQRFSDWYYAITVMRLGDQNARAPLERACQTFAQRIMDITNADELIDFAHQIVLEEIRQAGGNAMSSDAPNAMTGGEFPSTLLVQAAAALQPEQVDVLHRTYTDKSLLAAEQPLAALNARHALKVWLSKNIGVPFSVLPKTPALDQAPLPLYEAARLQSSDEVRAFEQWLVTDINLCKDIAEFSVFAHSIRAGALKAEPSAASVSHEQSAAPTRTPDVAQTSAPPATLTNAQPVASGGGSGKLVGIAILVVIIVGIIMLANLFM
ncbi:MAG: hypothetical protein P8R54_20895 [Myxococcota bacterium]|nr:hypothetical protein [Myxococcota bacterium]